MALKLARASFIQCIATVVLFLYLATSNLYAQMKTWDGRYPIAQIEVTMVYFVPLDRTAIVDWKERLQYYATRLEQFHRREFQGQSALKVIVREEPFSSKFTTSQLRAGDANQIYFKTMQEVDQGLKFGRGKDETFPILLVMSEINWRPLEDFYRVRPKGSDLEFEGNYHEGRHFPGAESGGARAVYWDNKGIGWGLVSADGWRVPYSGSDCVVYHEGVGHTIGLPHTDQADNSVMSLGQYHGWINESYVEATQKRKLGWKPASTDVDDSLFSKFTAIPSPLIPQPKQPVQLKCTWPSEMAVEKLTVEIQIDPSSPWIAVQQSPSILDNTSSPEFLELGVFDRPTPVSYRVRVSTKDKSQVELYGYFQVRQTKEQFPVPNLGQYVDLQTEHTTNSVKATDNKQHSSLKFGAEIDVLKQMPQELRGVAGDWTWQGTAIEAPKQYGARIELPLTVPSEYQILYVVEPLDEPNALTLGQISQRNRFLVLLDFANENQRVSALENIQGQNVGNETTVEKNIFAKNRISQVVCTVLKEGVTVEVDGQQVVSWQGDPQDLSLSDYWSTPDAQKLFIGAYDCRFRIHRVTVRPVER
jgi:hypothetical protein